MENVDETSVQIINALTRNISIKSLNDLLREETTVGIIKEMLDMLYNNLESQISNQS